jgi:hypothetical protein
MHATTENNTNFNFQINDMRVLLSDTFDLVFCCKLYFASFKAKLQKMNMKNKYI